MHNGQVLVVHHVFRPDDSPQALEVGTLSFPQPAVSAAQASAHAIGTCQRTATSAAIVEEAEDP